MKNNFKVFILLFSIIFSYQNVFAQIDIPMKDTLLSKDIVITGTRNQMDLRHLPMNVSIVNEKQIEGRYEQSLLPLLSEQVPGLFTTSRGIMGYGVSTGSSGGISMRGIGGSPTTGMLVLIDGHPQYMGLMGHPIADAYQSMMAEKVEVIRGPASVLYGSNAMGGVINILTNRLKKDELRNNVRLGYGSFNTLNTEISSRFRRKKFSSIITGSYNRTDGHRERMGFEQYGGYAKIGYEFSKNWNAFADINLTHFNASNPGTITRPIFDNDSRVTRGMASFSLENDYVHTSGAFKFFYNWGRHNINDGYYAEEVPKDYFFNSKDRMLGITLYQSVSFFRGNRITFGFDYQRFGGMAWNKFNDGTKKEIVNKVEDEVAGYIDFRQNISHIMTLDAGVRFDHHSRTGSQWIPQFGMSIYPTQTGEVKLVASRGFRNPTIRELYMFPPQNPDLMPENLWNYEISWSQRLFGSAFSYGVNIFYINGKNIIQTIMVNGRPLNVNTGKIENWGIELSTNYRISSAFSLSANYSWLNMKYPIIASPKHKLYAGVNFSKNRWAASAGIQYINTLYTSIKPMTAENFVLLGARVSFRATKWLEVFIKGENLLNQKYEINLGFPMPGATVMGGVDFHF